MIVENIKNVKKLNNMNLLNRIENDDEDVKKLNVFEKARKLESGVERGENYIIFKRRTNKGKRFNETKKIIKGNKRTFSCVGIEKVKSEHPNTAKGNRRTRITRRASLTPTNLRSLSVCSRDDLKFDNFAKSRRCGSTINRSQIENKLGSGVSPPRPRVAGALIGSLNRIFDNKTTSELIQTKEETLKSVEDRIIQKFSNSPVQNQQTLKRFQQLQEYINMANREIRINKNLKNETKRIVKGEIPLGTDTQINHNVRENYPRIREIKRRLKNCLMIKCDFDEVIKYAKEYFGIDKEESTNNDYKAEDRISSQSQFAKEDKHLKINKTYQNLMKPIGNKIIQEEDEDNKSELNNTNASFTRQKWNNIDELILVLQEELKDPNAN